MAILALIAPTIAATTTGWMNTNWSMAKMNTNGTHNLTLMEMNYPFFSHGPDLTGQARLSADINIIRAIQFIQGDNIANALVREHNHWIGEMYKGNQTLIDEFNLNSYLNNSMSR